MANVMKIEDALKKAADMMVMGAKAEKDRGAVTWTADLHVQVCGFIIRVLFNPKNPDAPRLEQTGDNYARVFYALYNQSAWRQKFEKAEIFAKAAGKSFESKMNELEEEFAE
jgi:uncharacterized protein (DUF2147 family)